MNDFITLALVAGVLAVDERAGWQSLLHEPVFAGLLVGVVVGEIAAALSVGLVLQLVWLSILPMRGLRRPDQVIGTVVGAGTAALLVALTADPRFIFVTSVSTFIGLLAGELGGRVMQPFFRYHNRYLSQVDFENGAEARGIARRLSVLHVGSIAYIFAVEAVVAGVLLSVSFLGAERFTQLVDGSFAEGAVAWRLLVPALGAAALIHLYWQPHLKRLLVLSTVLTILVIWRQ